MITNLLHLWVFIIFKGFLQHNILTILNFLYKELKKYKIPILIRIKILILHKIL